MNTEQLFPNLKELAALVRDMREGLIEAAFSAGFAYGALWGALGASVLLIVVYLIATRRQ